MNILRKIAIKNLRLNKKRSIVTIIGIILAVSLITSVITLICSFRVSTIEFTKRNYGDYHYEFFNIPINNLNSIKNNKNIEQCFITKYMGNEKLKNRENIIETEIFGLSKEAMNKIGINLIEGEMPQNEHEIVISENMIVQEKLELKVGSEITFEDNDKLLEKFDSKDNKKYKIVGIARVTKQNIQKQFMGLNAYLAFLQLKETQFTDNINVYVRYKDLNKRIETIAEILEIDNNTLNELKADSQIEIEQNIADNETNKYMYTVNTELIRRETGEYLDQTSTMIYTVSIIIITIIIIVSVYCIKNILNMSITERTKSYGMLLSIGATSKQIRSTLLYEAGILAIISIPIGILLGVLYTYIVLELLKQLTVQNLFGMQFIFSTNGVAISISALISIVIIYLAQKKAIKRASKLSPISAIKNNKDISINFNNIKAPKLIKKCFGIEGVIAYKNLKRNKKKYKATILAMIISSAVCIAMVSFTNYAFKITELYYKNYKYNICIYGDNYQKLKEIMEDFNIKSNKYELNREEYGYIKNVEGNYTKEVLNLNFLNNYKLNMVLIEALGNDEYMSFIKKLGLKYDNVKNKAILLDYKVDTTKIEGKRKNVEFRLYKYKKGDIIELERDDKSIEIEIANVTNVRPMGLRNSNMAYLIVSDSFFEQYTANNEFESNSYILYVQSKKPNDMEEYIKENYKTSYSYLENIDREERNQKAMYTFISIFLYSFVFIMICIGLTNMFNTITTFIELRQKEFAYLKSIGMTKRQFNNMLRLESIFYTIKALIIGIPLGIGISYLIYKAFSINIDTYYIFPLNGVIISTIGIYMLTLFCTKFSMNKINKQNIIDIIRNDNI